MYSSFLAEYAIALAILLPLFHKESRLGNDSKLLIVFYVQIMPDDFVMQLHRF
ncbi:aldehyde dehydrogenase [Pantoea sp. AV62]|nr:aldehyde dehydrogenase [Pantoea sp. AV62]